MKPSFVTGVVCLFFGLITAASAQTEPKILQKIVDCLKRSACKHRIFTRLDREGPKGDVVRALAVWTEEDWRYHFVWEESLQNKRGVFCIQIRRKDASTEVPEEILIDSDMDGKVDYARTGEMGDRVSVRYFKIGSSIEEENGGEEFRDAWQKRFDEILEKAVRHLL